MILIWAVPSGTGDDLKWLIKNKGLPMHVQTTESEFLG